VTQQQQERRIYNEAIESAVLDVIDEAASIETYYYDGIGVIIELSRAYYFKLNILYKLVSPLEEMKSSQKLSDEIRGWLREPRSKDAELKERLFRGIDLFEKYHTAISQNGLLALPQRGR
jgi:hypothetical protein